MSTQTSGCTMKRSGFQYAEATIGQIHNAMRTGEVTCRQLIEWYLNRINRYDKQGPNLNTVILINPNVLAEADRLDEAFHKNGFSGPLHGIPILLKDNFETENMPTTAGSLSMEGFISGRNAFIVNKLLKAGAIILAKTNLHEFAIWGETTSSILGQTRNPYDLTRTPGGSSGGTGAGIAANFGLIGMGTDTINSVRSPSSANSLVGIRPTLGLVSRGGIVPYSLTQDMAGPITRTVEDAVKVLTVITGYDPNDPATAWSYGQNTADYISYLTIEGLRGKRIGVLESFFGLDAIHTEVSALIRKAINAMQEAGATIISVQDSIDSTYLASKVSLHLFDFKADFNQYLRQLGDIAPIHSLEEVISSGKFHQTIEENIRYAQTLDNESFEYKQRMCERRKVREQTMKLIADYKLDALVYPHQKRPVVPIGETQVERNGVLGSLTGFPSIVVPAGFTTPDENAPIGVPVGLEILGAPWTEGKLISIAYAFEQATQLRRPPVCVPFDIEQ